MGQSRDTSIIHQVDSLYKVVITENSDNNSQVIKYWTKSQNMLGLSKDILFMRGIKMDEKLDYIERLDSLKIIDRSKNVEREEYFGDEIKTIVYEYDSIGVSSYSMIIKDKLGRSFYFSDSKLKGVPYPKLKNEIKPIGINRESFQEIGKVGESKELHVSIFNNDVKPIELNINVSQPSIVPKKSRIECLPDSIMQLQFSLNFLSEDYNSQMLILSERDTLYMIDIQAQSFDVGSENFCLHSELRGSQTLTINKEILRISLHSNEKLLHIKNDGLVIHTQPVSKVVNEVNVSEFKNGDYILEIKDLGTGISRFCKINIAI